MTRQGAQYVQCSVCGGRRFTRTTYGCSNCRSRGGFDQLTEHLDDGTRRITELYHDSSQVRREWIEPDE